MVLVNLPTSPIMSPGAQAPDTTNRKAAPAVTETVSPTWLGQTVLSAKQLQDYEWPITLELVADLYHQESNLVRALTNIQTRVSELLTMIDKGDVLSAAREVRSCAGACGPIGSQWEKATESATALNVLTYAVLRYSGEKAE